MMYPMITETGSLSMRNDYSSMKPFGVRCNWWRPESPDDQTPGSVGFDGKNLVCSLDRWFGSIAELFMGPREFDVLHAETLDGVPVSAFDCFADRNGSNAELVVNSLGVGSHLLSLSKQEFSSAKAFINGLEVWQRCSSIEANHAPDGTLTIQCAAPTGFGMRIPGRLTTVSLGQDMRRVGGGRSIKVDYESHFGVEPDAPQVSTWFQTIIDESRQLITLFLDQDAELTGLKMTPVGERDREVDWYWNRRSHDVQEIRRTQALILQADLQNPLEDVLATWLSKTEQLQYARALLFSSEASPAPFLEKRFLPIVQAIEVYCRSLGSEKYVCETEFKRIKKALLDVVPDGLDKGLSEKLRTSIGFANELGLKDRILQLLNSLEPETRCFVCQDSDKFARLLKDSRNYYTHYGIPNKKALKGRDLHWATKQASQLLKIILMKECGIPESLIRSKLDESNWHRQGMTIWAEIERGL